MKAKRFVTLFVFFVAVLLSYRTGHAQIVDKTNDPANKPKATSVSTTKPAVVITNNLERSAANGAATTTMKSASTSKAFGNHTLKVTENVTGQSYEGGKWFTVTKWDGSKWVSKREWFPNKKD
jgi:hypothetical protein